MYIDNSLLNLFKTMVLPPIFQTIQHLNVFHVNRYKWHIFASQPHHYSSYNHHMYAQYKYFILQYCTVQVFYKDD